jgi:hypothetical protein
MINLEDDPTVTISNPSSIALIKEFMFMAMV